jgi:multidrug efflux system membrane fusion protein
VALAAEGAPSGSTPLGGETGLNSAPPPVPANDAAEPKIGEIRPRGRRLTVAWLLGLVVLILGATVVVDHLPVEEKAEAPAAQQAVPVTVADVTTHDVPVYLDGLGTVQASNTVAIRTQVDGKLQSVNFVEGQHVKKGDVLAIVDPRPFQAALDQAKAKKAQDQAQLVSDEKDLARFKDLVGKGAGTQQSVDQQQAKVDALKATIDADEAAIESAATQLSYATITAPIDGRIGFRQVDAGNIVRAADQSPITVLTALTPAMVVFTLPQRDLAAVREAMVNGAVPVVAMDQDNTRELGKGKLLLIDNQIDQATSTIRLKASFPNEDERLWPGEFIQARVLVKTLKDAVTIPSAAVQRNAQGLLAWVIKPDDMAETRPILAGPSYDDMTVVQSGLEPGDSVVVSGQYRLRPGVKVEAAPAAAPVAETQP